MPSVLSAQPFINYLNQYVEVSSIEKKRILDIIHFASYGKNELVLKEGEVCSKMTFVLEGLACVYYEDENEKKKVMSFRSKNEMLVNYESFISRSESDTCIIALEPTEVMWASHSDFFNFLQTFPKYEAVMREILGKYLIGQMEKEKLQRIESAKERYEIFCRNNPELIKRAPLTYIASYLGMALETLSRIRGNK